MRYLIIFIRLLLLLFWSITYIWENIN